MPWYKLKDSYGPYEGPGFSFVVGETIWFGLTEPDWSKVEGLDRIVVERPHLLPPGSIPQSPSMEHCAANVGFEWCFRKESGDERGPPEGLYFFRMR